jgi:RNA polymerase sigma-70 factor (ECF subfamily)
MAARHKGGSSKDSKQTGARVYAPSFFKDDVEFVQALQAGRPDAQAELFRRHHERVAAVLHRVLGDDADLQDMLQEVFLRAMTAARRFRGTNEVLEPWLVRIAVFTARGLIRRRRLWRRFFSATEPTNAVAASTASIEQLEALQRTYAVFDKLPTDERIALALNLIDKMPLPQIAEACGVSTSTIKRRLRKANQRFQAMVSRDPILRDLSIRGES